MQDPSYQYLRELIRDLQVVNDAAQRATIDVAEYAEMTRDPVYWDDIILVANGHRGRDAQLRRATSTMLDNQYVL